MAVIGKCGGVLFGSFGGVCCWFDDPAGASAAAGYDVAAPSVVGSAEPQLGKGPQLERGFRG